MEELDLNVQYVKGIGEKRAVSLSKLGITTLGDLVSYFPRAYEDRSVISKIADIPDGASACVSAYVISYPVYSRIRSGLDTVKLRAADDSGIVDITFFNQPYVRDKLEYGKEYTFYGKFTQGNSHALITNPLFERTGTQGSLTGRIVPIYRLSAGLNQKLLIGAVSQALQAADGIFPEILPERILDAHGLCRAEYAYRNIHFPDGLKSLEAARRKLVFEELFVLACALGQLGKRESSESGYIVSDSCLDKFQDFLPFALTGAQKKAMSHCAADMASGKVMNRLLQGDVGSGKTAVAAGLIWLTFKAGFQSAFMAPTSILAEQHYRTLTNLLSGSGMKIHLLTGSMGQKAKREVKELLKYGYTDLVVGTHAIISENVEFHSLALAVTDEQHRFGVYQRAALSDKGENPHVLVMSATPIPRTLALIIYGDLDISVINELPPGRKKVESFLVDESMRPRINKFIERLVSEGRQVFVVCPLIEESETLEAKSAHAHAEHLKTVFPQLRIAEVHGKMKAAQKDAVMGAFAGGETDVLVSTTVIEVGVDVPNAALMVIENAERFGLSQLHQLRGRVGRGSHKSYCVLFNGGGRGSAERLRAFCALSDGFKIAEEDLKLRGPGDFFGSRQHGLPVMKLADLNGDMSVLEEAQNAAAELLSRDSRLLLPEHSALRTRITELLEHMQES